MHAHTRSVRLETFEDDPHWSSWPLPLTDSNALFDASIYARDCVAFANQFLELSGLRPRGPRLAPQALRSTQQTSLEERSSVCLLFFVLASSRNRALLRRSFFSERFTERALLEARACGVRLACEMPLILCLAAKL